MGQKRLNLGDVKSLVAAYFANKKIADPTWTPGKEDVSGLINTIMKMVVIDGNFNDKLPELDGSREEFGEAIEEYFIGLVPVQAYDDYEADATNAANDALKPYRPSFDQVVFSERLDRKKFATTIDYNKYVESLQDASQLSSLTALVMKRLYDGKAVWKYGVKKGLLGVLANKAIAANAGESYTQNVTELVCGKIFVSGNIFYIMKKNLGKVNKPLAQIASEGDATVITPSMVAELAIPTTTETGEAFIEAVKNAVEDAGFVNEGSSLSGSTIGAENGLVLYIKKGIMSNVEVQTLAGAFNEARLAIPATIKVVEDFGNANAKVWAVLTDPRGIKLHNNYEAVREQENGSGDYINYFLHTQDTGYLSNHTFVKVFMTE